MSEHELVETEVVYDQVRETSLASRKISVTLRYLSRLSPQLRDLIASKHPRSLPLSEKLPRRGESGNLLSFSNVQDEVEKISSSWSERRKIGNPSTDVEDHQRWGQGDHTAIDGLVDEAEQDADLPPP